MIIVFVPEIVFVPDISHKNLIRSSSKTTKLKESINLAIMELKIMTCQFVDQNVSMVIKQGTNLNVSLSIKYLYVPYW